MATIEDMRVPPQLGPDESVTRLVPAREASLLRDDVLIAATTDRLVISPRRGQSVSGFEGDRALVSIPVEQIAVIRRTGLRRHTIELVTNDERVYELPPVDTTDADDLIDHLVEATALERTPYGARESTTTQAFAILGTGGAVLVGLTGLLLVAAGIGLALTFVGIFLGMLFIGVGALLAWGAWSLGHRWALVGLGTLAEWR